VSTVRVVNSPRLWDNQLKDVYRSRYFLRAYGTMILIVLLILLIGLEFEAHHTTLTGYINSAQSVIHSQPSQSSPAALPKILLPEQNNPSTLLVQKLATPPPPPPANCQIDACLALTFDDGPDAVSSPIILSALEKAHVKATFFLIGSYVSTNPAIVQRMQADGDDIGNHSWTHPYFTKLPAAQVQQQINMTQAAIVAAGARASVMFRPPYGDINQTVANEINLPIIMWNVDPKDWAQKDSNTIAQIVEAQAKPGAIIVMHDKPLTAAAMDKIVTDLKTKYRLVTVSQLLNLNPTSRGIYFGR